MPGLSHLPGYSGSLQVVSPGPAGTESLARGYQLYQRVCAMCHGADLKGESVQPLMPRRDLTHSAQYKYGASDQALYRTILYGLPRTAMGSYDGSLKPQDVWDLIAFIKSKRVD